MLKFWIAVLVVLTAYAGVAKVLTLLGITFLDWQYWAIMAGMVVVQLATAAFLSELNKRID